MKNIERLFHTNWEHLEHAVGGAPLGVTLHQVEPSAHGFVDTAAGVCNLYQQQPKYKKSDTPSLPFHIIIEPNGCVVQTAPLDRKLKGGHACKGIYVGICCIGNDGADAMSAAQMGALVGICARLMRDLNGTISARQIATYKEVYGAEYGELFGPGRGQHLLVEHLRSVIQTALHTAPCYNLAWHSIDFASESHSGILERLGPATFALHVQDDLNNARLPVSWRAWWHVCLDPVGTQSSTTVQIDRIAWKYPAVPSYSYDREKWHAFAEAEVKRPDSTKMLLSHTFASSPVWIAQREPFTSVHLAQLVADVQQVGSADSSISVQVAQLGRTPQRRPVVMVTLTDSRALSGKQRVWVHARVHPGEPQASWMADGLLRFLVGDAPQAHLARSKFVFHVVPLLNPDGVALGHYRTDAQGQNLEGLWDVDAPPQEIMLLKDTIAELRRQGPDFAAALKLHSSHAPRGQPPFSFPHFGPQTLGYTDDEARLWHGQMRFTSAVREALLPRPFQATWGDAAPAAAPAGRAFLGSPMPERWWWKLRASQVMALTVEAVDSQVGLGGRWSNAEDARAVGAALTAGLLAV